MVVAVARAWGGGLRQLRALEVRFLRRAPRHSGLLLGIQEDHRQGPGLCLVERVATAAFHLEARC